MQHPRNKRTPARRTTRWTLLEIVMLAAATLMIVFPLYSEAYRWVRPALVPAAPREQRATQTPIGTTPTNTTTAPTNTPTNTTTGATNTPTNTTTAATNTPTNTTTAPTNTPTNTVTGATNTPTNTTTGATNTPTNTTTGATNTPTNTTTGATATPTTTAVPGTPTATFTPVPNEPPLRLFKSASTGEAQIGEQFSYTLSVYSNSTTANNVTVTDDIDSQLAVVGTNTTKGSCSVSGQRVTCIVPVQNNQPVTINITVRVSATAAPNGRITNQAAAQDTRSFTAASDSVAVDIGDIIPTATTGASTPTDTPTIGTTTPTDTPTTGAGTPTDTPTTGGGTTTPPTNTPTSKPSGGGGDKKATSTPPAPTAPAVPALPPTPKPGAAPTARPGAARPTVRPGTPQPGATAGATSAPATATATPLSTFFRVNSDWGSAFVGQEVTYVIAFRNSQPSAAITNLLISSALPENLELLSGIKSTVGDPQQQGNTISLKVASLAAGQDIEITIPTKIKAKVDAGTRLVSQAEATYDGLAQPLRSNIVTVLVLGQASGPVAQAATSTAAPTATATATATSAAAPTATSGTTPAPAATAAAKPPVAAPPAAPTLPNTSTGVPLSGFALLGLTLLLRTVRLHRAQTRI